MRHLGRSHCTAVGPTFQGKLQSSVDFVILETTKTQMTVTNQKKKDSIKIKSSPGAGNPNFFPIASKNPGSKGFAI